MRVSVKESVTQSQVSFSKIKKKQFALWLDKVPMLNLLKESFQNHENNARFVSETVLGTCTLFIRVFHFNQLVKCKIKMLSVSVTFVRQKI